MVGALGWFLAAFVVVETATIPAAAATTQAAYLRKFARGAALSVANFAFAAVSFARNSAAADDSRQKADVAAFGIARSYGVGGIHDDRRINHTGIGRWRRRSVRWAGRGIG
jgi:hypothetical protein